MKTVNNKENVKKLIGTAEASKILGMSLSKVKGLCRDQTLGFPAVKIGGKYYINKEMLDRWIDRVTGQEVEK